MRRTLEHAVAALKKARETKPTVDLCCWLGTVFDEREKQARHDKMWLLRLTFDATGEPKLIRTPAVLVNNQLSQPMVYFPIRPVYKVTAPDGTKRNVCYAPDALLGPTLERSDLVKNLTEGTTPGSFNPMDGADKYLVRVLDVLDKEGASKEQLLPDFYLVADARGDGVMMRENEQQEPLLSDEVLEKHGWDGKQPVMQFLASKGAEIGIVPSMPGKFGWPFFAFHGKGIVTASPDKFIRWFELNEPVLFPWLHIEKDAL